MCSILVLLGNISKAARSRLGDKSTRDQADKADQSGLFAVENLISSFVIIFY